MSRLAERITNSFHISLAAAYQMIGGLAASPLILSTVTAYLLVQRVIAPVRPL